MVSSPREEMLRKLTAATRVFGTLANDAGPVVP
jgi:hypothetical protein